MLKGTKWHHNGHINQNLLICKYLGGQDRAAVKRPLRNDKDVGSNPAAAKRKTDVGDPPTEGCPMVWTRS